MYILKKKGIEIIHTCSEYLKKNLSQNFSLSFIIDEGILNESRLEPVILKYIYVYIYYIYLDNIQINYT